MISESNIFILSEITKKSDIGLQPLHPLFLIKLHAVHSLTS